MACGGGVAVSAGAGIGDGVGRSSVRGITRNGIAVGMCHLGITAFRTRVARIGVTTRRGRCCPTGTALVNRMGRGAVRRVRVDGIAVRMRRATATATTFIPTITTTATEQCV